MVELVLNRKLNVQFTACSLLLEGVGRGFLVSPPIQHGQGDGHVNIDINTMLDSNGSHFLFLGDLPSSPDVRGEQAEEDSRQ